MTTSTSQLREDTGFSVRQVFERRLVRDECLFEEGDTGDTVYVVQAGQIELTREGPDGPRLISRKGPGALIGEMDVLLGSLRTASARSLGVSCVLQLDGATFEAMCIEQPEIAIRVIQGLAERAKNLERRLTALGGDDLLRPTVRVLLRHAAAEQGSNGLRKVPLALRDLAREAGLSMLETHRALTQLVDRKLVKLAADTLYVPDHETLAAALEPPEDPAGH
ncbi:MAG: Crp/Fnr family transcriptional regulator [bacterium]|nr:Crp/Fnr family transcriptional regulator [bacterium]MCP5070665.1 Crp/Fnr family transcriptional regulator [bacterium]